MITCCSTTGGMLSQNCARSPDRAFDSGAGIWVVLELLTSDEKETKPMISRRKQGTTKLAVLVFFGLLSLGARASAQSTPADIGDRRPERGTEMEVWTGAGADPIG